jgi:hypothetical protein
VGPDFFCEIAVPFENGLGPNKGAGASPRPIELRKCVDDPSIVPLQTNTFDLALKDEKLIPQKKVFPLDVAQSRKNEFQSMEEQLGRKPEYECVHGRLFRVSSDEMQRDM